MEIKGNPVWYRQPAQRPVSVCYNSSWQRVWLDNVKKVIEEYDFDGVYLVQPYFPTIAAMKGTTAAIGIKMVIYMHLIRYMLFVKCSGNYMNL